MAEQHLHDILLLLQCHQVFLHLCFPDGIHFKIETPNFRCLHMREASQLPLRSVERRQHLGQQLMAWRGGFQVRYVVQTSVI